MKVKSITSFFQRAGSSTRGASVHDDEEEEDVVELSSRGIKKGGSKKPKKEKAERSRVHIGKGGDSQSDDEDQSPKSKSRKKKSDQKEKGGKSRKALVISDEDSDIEEVPKPSKKKDVEKDKAEKKRKAKVLSDSEGEDSTPRKKRSSTDKPAAKLAKIEKPPPPQKKELKPMNPADFFSSAPIKREVKKETAKAPESTVLSKQNKKDEPEPLASSPVKNGKSSSTPPPKSVYNGNQEDSPHRPPTSLIEPKKLKMPTPTPEKIEAQAVQPSASSKIESPPKSKTEKKAKISSPVKQEPTLKVPTPVTNEKSKSRVKSTAQKRHIVEDDDDEEEDFNPKKEAASKSTSSSSKAPAQGKSVAKRASKSTTQDSGTDEEAPKKPALTAEQKENFKKFLAKKSMQPQNLGSKEIPVGAPNCLQGLTFVITGVLDSLERDDCKDLVVKYGGRVTGSVSGKTNYLIIGDEAGASKIKKAVQLKIPQINEDELLDMIRRSNPAVNSQDSGMPFSEDISAIESEQFKTEDEESGYDADKSLFESPAVAREGRKSTPPKSGPSKLAKQDSPRKKSPEKNTKMDHQSRKKVEEKKPESNFLPARVSTVTAIPSELMWVDKYKPKTLKNVVGQGTETSNAKKLLRWLQTWFKYHGSSTEKVKAAWPGLRDPEGKTFKAALLSGPPGIGKTTSAHLVLKELGYDYFELNASDTRNKKGLHQNVADALSSKTLAFGMTDGDKARKHVLIMDEVDGMSGNEDRGGVQELIGLIKSSRVPVICICNDRNHQKIRSLANYCFDLRFNKPSFEQLRAFVLSICFKEKITIPQEKIRQLIISTDNDVRQILHQLELFKEGKSEQAFNPRKDLKFGPWDVIRKVFLKSEHANMSIHDKNGLFFQDYSLGPLFVQENYLKWAPAAAGGNHYKYLDFICKTAGSLADGDLVENVIRRNQNWSLLPVQGVFQSYLPGEYMASHQMGGVDFPQWLGKNSNRNKRHRLLQSLHSHLQLHVSGSLEALNMDYLPYFRRTLTKPLVEGDHETAARLMEEYTLLRDDVESITDLSLWPGTINPMEKVDSKVKAAFTRQVNKEMLPYSNAKPTKCRGRAASTEDDLSALLEEGEENVEEEEEEDTIEKDAMVKIKTKKAGSSKAKTTASSSKGKKGKKMDDDEESDDDAKSSKRKPAKSRKGK